MNTYVLEGHTEIGGIDRAGFGQAIGMLISQSRAQDPHRFQQEIVSFKQDTGQQNIGLFWEERPSQATYQDQNLEGVGGGGSNGQEQVVPWEESKNAFAYKPYQDRPRFLHSPYQTFEGSDILY